uniref:Uncharacterized protein n=1 Tax=Plectus sambesii TaxID=2011161 RepID=A0A914XEH8_9BILA
MKPSVSAIVCLFAVLAAATTIAFGQKVGQATQPPCCRNWIGDRTCSKMRLTNFIQFNSSCYNDPDFAFNQCCATCNSVYMTDLGYNFTGVAQSLLINNTGNCFDRMSTSWCQKLLLKTGVWTKGLFTCDSSNLAFRVCRLTCGYCSTTGDTYIASLYLDASAANAACSDNANTKAVIGR